MHRRDDPTLARDLEFHKQCRLELAQQLGFKVSGRSKLRNYVIGWAAYALNNTAPPGAQPEFAYTHPVVVNTLKRLLSDRYSGVIPHEFSARLMSIPTTL